MCDALPSVSSGPTSVPEGEILYTAASFTSKVKARALLTGESKPSRVGFSENHRIIWIGREP